MSRESEISEVATRYENAVAQVRALDMANVSGRTPVELVELRAARLLADAEMAAAQARYDTLVRQLASENHWKPLTAASESGK